LNASLVRGIPRASFLAVFALGIAVSALAQGAGVAARPLVWTTLGTAAGPALYAERSQPANMMRVDGKPWLIDCGDGALERLAAAGVRAAAVDTVFITHLHMDHIGGLQALIGLRWMQNAKSTLTIYGPPGTDEVVEGLLHSMKPVARIELGESHQPPPDSLVRVVIVEDGSALTVDGVQVRAVRNSHFDDTPGHPADNGTQSLAYRFDYQGASIGVTGDTGPSEAVARLDKDVDLLVSEVIDVDGVVASLGRAMPNMSGPMKDALVAHLRTQHLTPEEAGRLATQAGAHRLVFTHLGIVGPTAGSEAKLIEGAHRTYSGDVQVARDLDQF
jgi:ribonuclease BN (tRNA processing enzyme)